MNANITVSPATAPLRGEITVPGDKSISHRSIMFGALAQGTTRIRGFLRGADCLSSISCFRRMGIRIDDSGEEILVFGRGLHGLRRPGGILDAGNSGTTVRLMSGILAGQPFPCTVTGDASIQKRPMKRIMVPLSMMGADITSARGNNCAPLALNANGPAHRLRGIRYDSPVASAQVKSCVLLAGLYAGSETLVTEPALSRDHTERMLRGFGADVRSFTIDDPASPADSPASPTGVPASSARGTRAAAAIQPEPLLHAADITVPGDISSAAYFIAAGLIVPGSEILIRSVGINPTRDGILRVAMQMGGDITLLNERDESGEPVADILVKHSHLKAVRVDGALIPTLIDELPVVAVLAACAEGTTVIADAAELKVKESDRISTVSQALRSMGVTVTPTEDGMIIEGRGAFASGSETGMPSAPANAGIFRGAVIDSCNDHRIAMSFAVAALAADSDTIIKGAECVGISYPLFFEDLYSL